LGGPCGSAALQHLLALRVAQRAEKCGYCPRLRGQAGWLHCLVPEEPIPCPVDEQLELLLELLEV